MPSDGRIVVFAGPSLPPSARPADARFAWRPPAAAGDGYALSGFRPRAVVLIDGLFDEQPAIRHKELLDIVGRGIPLIGGASMGALRAAELSPFGMLGVGKIFQAFASGRLEGDDEVAVLHGPQEFDWLALTEPLVNVRATLAHAARRRIVDVATARRVLSAARRIFYKVRTWPDILQSAEQADRPNPSGLAALRNWLPIGRVDMKLLDAVACLDRARRLDELAIVARPFPPRTVFIEALVRRVCGTNLDQTGHASS